MTRTISWVTIVITAIVGIFFICFFNEIGLFSWLVIALGIMLIIPGGALLFQALSATSVNASVSAGQHTATASGKAGRYSIILVSIVAIVMGICMIADPGFFIKILAYIFAAALIVYGVYQIVTVAYYSGSARMPWFYYIVPALTVIIGVVIIFTPVHTMNNIVTLLTGILLLSAAINWGMQRIMMKRYSITPSAAEPKQIEENVD